MLFKNTILFFIENLIKETKSIYSELKSWLSFLYMYISKNYILYIYISNSYMKKIMLSKTIRKIQY